MASDSFWTDEKTKKLKELLKNPALSAGDIGLQLGGVTRSAVLGKIHRMGLPWIRRDNGTKEFRSAIYGGSSKRRTPSKLKGQGTKTEAQRALIHPVKTPEKREAAVIKADGWKPPLEALPAELVTLDEWDTANNCMAPYLESPVRFGCCEKRVPGLSYCERHARKFLAGVDPRTARKLAAATAKIKNEEMA